MARINGTSANDRIDGTEARDDIFAGLGADVVDAKGGDDWVYGSGGADTLFGGAGHDVLFGGEGRDLLIGGAGDDELVGDGPVTLDAGALAVMRLYQATLGRAPDDAGWTNWIDRLSQDAKLSDIAAGFVGSAEFQSAYGHLSNDQFIGLLYHNVLGRRPDDAGFGAWMRYMDAGASRAEVALQFAQSAEFQAGSNPAGYTGQIFRLYDTMFNREADTAGLLNWIDARAGGMTLAKVADRFLASAEYQKTYGALDDKSFVTALYQNVLDRAPDAAGLKNWTDALAQGRSRAEVALAFSESQEHVSLTAAWLNHVADTKLADFSDTLIGGPGENWLTGGRGSDYFVVEAKDQSLVTIYGYETFDRVALSGFGFKAKADVLTHAWQQGGDVYFNSAGTTVIFEGVQLATLQATLEDRWVLA